MSVVDAGVVVAALTDDEDLGERARDALLSELVLAPSLIDLEVVSAVRRMARREGLPLGRARDAIAALKELAVERVHHHLLVARCWELRDNVTPYDAAYVALAEMHSTTLVTVDRRLATSPGPTCPFEVL